MHKHWQRQFVLQAALAMACAAGFAGCGSTRTSNTMRTATEQMLISDAVDRTVDAIDFGPLSGRTVFFDDTKLVDVVDRGYLVSSLRQHMLASGCVLKENRADAEFVVEPRAGAVGTDNHDLLFGVPAIQLPQVPLAPTMPAAIPEIPFAKRRDQSGVAKIAVFAYRRDTGEPVWQSGLVINKSTANDIWLLGAGPFQRGTIYDSAQFAGKNLVGDDEEHDRRNRRVAGVDDEAVFAGLNAGAPTRAVVDGVQQATALAPVQPTLAAAPAPVAAPAPEAAPAPAPIAAETPVLPPPLAEAPPP